MVLQMNHLRFVMRTVKQIIEFKCFQISKCRTRIRKRNFGVKKATGEYISFLDSDDQYKKDMLKKLQKSGRNNADMVSGGYADICNGNLIKEHPLDNEILDSNVKIKESYVKFDLVRKKRWICWLYCSMG